MLLKSLEQVHFQVRKSYPKRTWHHFPMASTVRPLHLTIFKTFKKTTVEIPILDVFGKSLTDMRSDCATMCRPYFFEVEGFFKPPSFKLITHNNVFF